MTKWKGLNICSFIILIMVNSVLTTIDINGDYRDTSSFENRLLAFMRELTAKLGEHGVAVETYKPSSFRTKSERIKLHARMELSDIIIHNRRLMEEIHPFEFHLIEGIDDAIQKEYAHRSHTFFKDKYDQPRSMNAAGVPIPKTMEVEEYLDTARELPVVVKHRNGTLGKEVFYLDMPDQIDAFFKLRRKEVYVTQAFIETPSDRFTTYRIFTVGDEILCAVLTVSKTRKSKWERQADGFYPIQSNVGRGGFQIPISYQNNEAPLWFYCNMLTDTKLSILQDHGIVPLNVGLPDRLDALARLVGRELSKYGMLLFAGQDWIQDPQGNIYFLEANPLPGFKIFNNVFFNGESKKETYEPFAIDKIAGALHRYVVSTPS